MKKKALLSVVLYILAGISIFIGSLLKIAHKGGDFFIATGLGLNILFIIGVILFGIAYFVSKANSAKE